jgi:adenine phosphoribosyltransferase
VSSRGSRRLDAPRAIGSAPANASFDGRDKPRAAAYHRAAMPAVDPLTAPSDYIRSHIRTVPDWPAPGVMFRDITTLLSNPRVFRILVDQFVHRWFDARPNVVAGLDARGFIIGSVIAYELGVGFVPIRKKGKLPHTTLEETYALEYGSATVELHTDAVQRGDRVLLVDDLIATGGTITAGIELLREAGAEVIGCAFVIELPELGGGLHLERLDIPFHALVAC